MGRGIFIKIIQESGFEDMSFQRLKMIWHIWNQENTGQEVTGAVSRKTE